MASKSVIPFLVGMMLLTGVCNTLLTKYQDMQCVAHCESSKPRTFEQPVLQTLQMFVGESGCWLVVLATHLYRRWRGIKIEDSREDVQYHQVAPRDSSEEDRGLLSPSADQDEETHPDPSASQTLVDATNIPAKPFVDGEGLRTERKPLTGWKVTMLALPAICDILGTTLMNAGLLFVAASIYQMTRGALVLFVGLFSVIFLHRHLGGWKWASLFIVVAGVALVGLAGALDHGDPSHPPSLPGKTDPTPSHDHLLPRLANGAVSALESHTAAETLIGVLMIAGAQIFTASQFVLEESIMERYSMEPIQVVGWEGAFGFLFTLLGMGVLHGAIGQTARGRGGYFDAREGFHEIFTNRAVAVSSVLIMVSIGCFNFFGLSVTRQISATARSTIDTCRTLFIWLVSLGLGWESFKWLQVAGFVLLVWGTALFNEIVSPPTLPSHTHRRFLNEQNRIAITDRIAIANIFDLVNIAITAYWQFVNLIQIPQLIAEPIRGFFHSFSCGLIAPPPMSPTTSMPMTGIVSHSSSLFASGTIINNGTLSSVGHGETMTPSPLATSLPALPTISASHASPPGHWLLSSSNITSLNIYTAPASVETQSHSHLAHTLATIVILCFLVFLFKYISLQPIRHMLRARWNGPASCGTNLERDVHDRQLRELARRLKEERTKNATLQADNREKSTLVKQHEATISQLDEENGSLRQNSIVLRRQLNELEFPKTARADTEKASRDLRLKSLLRGQAKESERVSEGQVLESATTSDAVPLTSEATIESIKTLPPKNGSHDEEKSADDTILSAGEDAGQADATHTEVAKCDTVTGEAADSQVEETMGTHGIETISVAKDPSLADATYTEVAKCDTVTGEAADSQMDEVASTDQEELISQATEDDAGSTTAPDTTASDLSTEMLSGEQAPTADMDAQSQLPVLQTELDNAPIFGEDVDMNNSTGPSLYFPEANEGDSRSPEAPVPAEDEIVDHDESFLQDAPPSVPEAGNGDSHSPEAQIPVEEEIVDHDESFLQDAPPSVPEAGYGDTNPPEVQIPVENEIMSNDEGFLQDAPNSREEDNNMESALPEQSIQPYGPSQPSFPTASSSHSRPADVQSTPAEDTPMAEDSSILAPEDPDIDMQGNNPDVLSSAGLQAPPVGQDVVMGDEPSLNPDTVPSPAGSPLLSSTSPHTVQASLGVSPPVAQHSKAPVLQEPPAKRKFAKLKARTRPIQPSEDQTAIEDQRPSENQVEPTLPGLAIPATPSTSNLTTPSQPTPPPFVFSAGKGVFVPAVTSPSNADSTQDGEEDAGEEDDGETHDDEDDDDEDYDDEGYDEEDYHDEDSDDEREDNDGEDEDYEDSDDGEDPLGDLEAVGRDLDEGEDDHSEEDGDTYHTYDPATPFPPPLSL